jgi:hypothetical protein
MKKILITLSCFILAACVETTGTRGVVLTESGVQVSHRNPRFVAVNGEAVRRYCGGSSTSSAQENRIASYKNKFGDGGFESAVKEKVERFKIERMPCKMQTEEEKKANRGITGSIHEQTAYFRICPKSDPAQQAAVAKLIAEERTMQANFRKSDSVLLRNADLKTDEKIDEYERQLRAENIQCRSKF